MSTVAGTFACGLLAATMAAVTPAIAENAGGFNKSGGSQSVGGSFRFKDLFSGRLPAARFTRKLI